MRPIIIILFCFASFFLIASGKTISPYDFGLMEAINGEERFEALYRTHIMALRIGADVDYSGIGRVDLAIPISAKSIPLGGYTDFKSAEFHVLNRSKDFHLFSLVEQSNPITIDKKQLKNNRCIIKELKGRSLLLSISDLNPWVDNRKGYKYGANRSDIIVVKSGQMQNVPVMPYDNDYSSPSCCYYPLPSNKKFLKNVSFYRALESEYKTYFLKVEGQYNLHISNIFIMTPESQLYGDAAIKITNCAKIRFSDVTINGTYSSEKLFGYGIAMNNVYDVSFYRLKASGKWGVFGTNNVSSIKLVACEINRFDIHCYGRDVTCERTIFKDLYNQFSSVYGTIRFHKCSFIECIPVLIEYSYNAYTGFDLVFNNCNYKVSAKPGKNCIIRIGFLDDTENMRPELQEKCWPNIDIDKLVINAPPDVKEFFLLILNKPITSKKPIGYSRFFRLNKISYETVNPKELVLSNYLIPVDNSINVSSKNARRHSITIRDNIVNKQK